MAVLEARGVSVRFDGLAALTEVDVSLRAGEILGLIGPNGAGKTTLVNVVTGFQRPHSGAVRLNGVDVTHWAPHRIARAGLARAGLARTFQAIRLFPDLTVAENLEIAAVAHGASRAAARARAREILARLGFAAQAERRAAELPYGDERWIGIARALAAGPRVLLMDEPAAGLNESEAEHLRQAILGIRERNGCAILVIEHNMKLIMGLCDRVQVLEQGRTIEGGVPVRPRAARAAAAPAGPRAASPAAARCPSPDSCENGHEAHRRRCRRHVHRPRPL